MGMDSSTDNQRVLSIPPIHTWETIITACFSFLTWEFPRIILIAFWDYAWNLVQEVNAELGNKWSSSKDAIKNTINAHQATHSSMILFDLNVCLMFIIHSSGNHQMCYSCKLPTSRSVCIISITINGCHQYRHKIFIIPDRGILASPFQPSDFAFTKDICTQDMLWDCGTLTCELVYE